MHKSRLGGFIIDCQHSDLDEAASFWASALAINDKAPQSALVHGLNPRLKWRHPGARYRLR